MSGNPWDIRPKAPTGDSRPEQIFQYVGVALTFWEGLEMSLAELFDALLPSPSRAGFSAYTAITASASRGEMLQAAGSRVLAKTPDLLAKFKSLMSRIGSFSARRNEMAHGLVFDLGTNGFFFCPSNLNSRKWDATGKAKYQWVSSDLAYYAQQFLLLRNETDALTQDIKKLFTP